MLGVYRAMIVSRLAAKSPGDTFTLKELLGEHWPGDAIKARSLGKEFRKELSTFSQIEAVSKKSDNHWLYRKS